MTNNQELEKRFISAVRLTIQSNCTGNNVTPNISPILEVTSEIPLKNLDHWENLIRNELHYSSTRSIFSKWNPWHKQSHFITWLDLSSGDGYMREKAMHTLTGGAPNSFFFSIALRRLNDWVPQVRQAAKEKISNISKYTKPKDVVEALFTILPHWESWGRMQSDNKEILLRIIDNDQIINELKNKIIHAPSGPVAAILSQAGRINVLDSALCDISENAIQPFVRAKAYRCRFERKMVWSDGKKWKWTDIKYCKGHYVPIISARELSGEKTPIISLLNMAAIDKSSIVRRVAAEMLIKHIKSLGKDAKRLAKLFSNDTSPPVIERGQFALSKL